MAETLSSPREQTAGTPAYRTKLIEVALPLEAINVASAREKSIRHGHPSTLHLWWARRPLAACRAVLFSQLVDDPSAWPDLFPTDEAQEAERQRLFRIIEALVQWENSTNETILHMARREIARSLARGADIPEPETPEEVWTVLREHAPPVLDPFCGGGSIPLEAQRLGLEAYASDLNPVAVLITKALIEIPPKFAGMPPVNPRDRERAVGFAWKGPAGLAADVRYYGEWMREEAIKRIGHLYPKVKLPDGGEATVIAWLWARTVTCPNPACCARMPLVRSFALSIQKGKETWVEPVVDREARTVRFEVRSGVGEPPEPPKVGRGAKFRCLVCNQIADDQHIKDEARAGRMSQQLMVVVAEGQGGRAYIAPSGAQEETAYVGSPADVPSQSLADDPRNIWCVGYGLDTFDKLFTPRQLVALTTFSDLVGEARERVRQDAVATGLSYDGVPLEQGGCGAQAYSDAVATYLAFLVSKLADKGSTICTWDMGPTSSRTASGRSARVATVRVTFSRQAIPMTWDFAEVNFFSDSVGSIETVTRTLTAPLEILPARVRPGASRQFDATGDAGGLPGYVISTDPPYYDNIGYADLSDFFYVWLRRGLREVYPGLLSTLLVPKAAELVATPYRFGGDRNRAKEFFENGLGRAFARLAEAQDRRFPLTIYYAFKQAESEGSEPEVASTGWETMLSGLLRAGFEVHGTWPMRSELSNRMIASGTNALASSIVLVCRPRPTEAPLATRREFVAALRHGLPAALVNLQRGNIAPVDLLRPRSDRAWRSSRTAPGFWRLTARPCPSAPPCSLSTRSSTPTSRPSRASLIPTRVSALPGSSNMARQRPGLGRRTSSPEPRIRASRVLYEPVCWRQRAAVCVCWLGPRSTQNGIR
jgi:putative DNA methylase